ncbi:MAG: methyltransferase domain-containing protein [Cyclobacteriaceae bacterium]|jgi:ubiquinone/menaquinone biosynthesis C-methylase UbiE|nr:methyltransferase domain-containing protein [Cyclobacteriaceae bacterium]
MKYLFLVVLAYSSSAQNTYRDVYTKSAWSERDTWQRPQELIRLMNIKPGSSVADIGCHEGYMTIKLARAVGTSGNVFAVDVEQRKLDRLKEILTEQGLNNTILIRGDYDDPKLKPNSLDAAIIVDAYHEMDDHDEILRHIKSALRPEGRLLICEPIADERKNLSRSEQERKHELGIQYALQDLIRAGFLLIYQYENFVDRTEVKGDRMWVLVAKR